MWICVLSLKQGLSLLLFLRSLAFTAFTICTITTIPLLYSKISIKLTATRVEVEKVGWKTFQFVHSFLILYTTPSLLILFQTRHFMLLISNEKYLVVSRFYYFHDLYCIVKLGISCTRVLTTH